MLAELLPAPVHYRIADRWMWETPATPREEALIERAVEKRKREFRAGRHAAHALFKRLGIDHPDLLKGAQREPAWPAGWVGSISHTDGLCAVALVDTGHAQGIGLDVELATPLNPELRELICRPEELAQINALRQQIGAGWPLEKLVFSAKECIHKVYFPQNFHTLDFLDARIGLDWEQATFDAFILNPEPSPRIPISRLKGKFLFHQDWIFTAIVQPVQQ